jgi:hypothetical protein
LEGPDGSGEEAAKGRKAVDDNQAIDETKQS